MVIGDVSFLHDSNGLNFLRSENWPPMTIVVVNNRGGGIFDFLPIAEAVSEDLFDAYWSTPPFINISTLCQAFGVAHRKVSRPEELSKALRNAWTSHQHCIVEAITER